MGTYYLGLSMAGTVSAGTYTSGSLIELDSWLSKWEEAKVNKIPIELVAQKDYGIYKKGDLIKLNPNEIPDHNVKIKALTGSSGGGVSAALYLIGLVAGDLDKFLKDIWMSFDISEMLDVNDLNNSDKVYSLLNSLPIDKIQKILSDLKWDAQASERAASKSYLEDVVEVYQTLTSFEAIPYNLVTFDNHLSGSFKNHFDYIRFGFIKDNSKSDSDNLAPYRHNLNILPGKKIIENEGWKKIVEASPATAAFPIGFKARKVIRQRKEYVSKLFYLNYKNSSGVVHYDEIMPDWKSDFDSGETIEMEYFDGGTFNREPHDLARAALIRFLTKKGLLNENFLPHKADDVLASVILIDPFPSIRNPVIPGNEVTEIPTLVGQLPLIAAALLNQGRFHTDWIEKTADENHYSRYLISPVRKNEFNEIETTSLAGDSFSAFAGFIDKKYREHDYSLGHYNTYKFLRDYFLVSEDNTTVTYCSTASDETKEKYTALGWRIQKAGKEWYCQVIPRFENETNLNSQLPKWPSISKKQWDSVKEKALKRAKKMTEHYLSLGMILENGIWLLFLKKKVEAQLDKMGKQLEKEKLIK